MRDGRGYVTADNGSWIKTPGTSVIWMLTNNGGWFKTRTYPREGERGAGPSLDGRGPRRGCSEPPRTSVCGRQSRSKNGSNKAPAEASKPCRSPKTNSVRVTLSDGNREVRDRAWIFGPIGQRRALGPLINWVTVGLRPHLTKS